MAGKIKVPSELVPSQSNKIMLRSKYVYDDVKGHTQEEINAALEEQIESKVIEAGGVNWDTVPTAGSNNAVKSKDIKAALEKVTGYFVLDSNVLESTVDKTVTVADFPALAIGGSIKIKMLTKNTATNPTLRIGPANATAYPLYYNEERASADNSWEQDEIISVFFDGANYRASNSQGGGGKAEKIEYDSSQSRLTANNVQGALDELDENANFILDNVFDIAAATAATTNSTYITPLKLSDGGRWTVARQDAATGRAGHITIPVLVVGKTYRITFEYTSTLTTSAYVQLCRYGSTSGGNVSVVTVSRHGSIQASSSGTYSFVFTYDATTTRYLAFLFAQPAVGQLIEIHNVAICEINPVKDAVQKLIDENPIQDSDADSDLDIVDPQNNVLARFYNGHIKTKRFDSADLPDLLSYNNLKGKKLSIIGDSISTYQGYLVSNKSGYDGTTYAYYYPRYGVDSVDKTWWHKLLQLTGMELLCNCSWSGSTVTGDSTSITSAVAGCSTRRVSDVMYGSTSAPDVIIILIGINDIASKYLGTWTGSDNIPSEGTITTFREAYALMVKKVLTAYPASEVYLCTILESGKEGWDGDDSTAYPTRNATTGCTVDKFNTAIRDVAHALGADIIDMHSCGINYWNLDTYTGDRLHPNALGTTLMAKKAFQELKIKTRY